jgi:hypothetical protein
VSTIDLDAEQVQALLALAEERDEKVRVTQARARRPFGTVPDRDYERASRERLVLRGILDKLNAAARMS